jgi:hypothetical protein
MKLLRFNSFVNENKKTMLELVGEKHDKFPFELEEIGDLIPPYGGTVEALARHNDEYYIIKWCDMDDSNNRYILYQIDLELIRDYLEGKYSEKSLMEKSKSIWIFDSDGESDTNITKVKFEEIPHRYIGDKHFKIEFGSKFAKDLIANGWYPIGADPSPGWYFKDALGEKETKVKLRDDMADENGEPLPEIIEFYKGRLYKR